jgi:hypothetical protein
MIAKHEPKSIYFGHPVPQSNHHAGLYQPWTSRDRKDLERRASNPRFSAQAIIGADAKDRGRESRDENSRSTATHDLKSGLPPYRRLAARLNVLASSH